MEKLETFAALKSSAEDGVAPADPKNLTLREVGTLTEQETKSLQAQDVLRKWLQQSEEDWQATLSTDCKGLGEEMAALQCLLSKGKLSNTVDEKLSAVKTFAESKDFSSWFKEQSKAVKALKMHASQIANKIVTTVKTYQKAHAVAAGKKAAQAKKAAKQVEAAQPKATQNPEADRAEPAPASPLLEIGFLGQVASMTVYNSFVDFSKAKVNWTKPFVVKGLQSLVRDRFEKPSVRSSCDYFESVIEPKSAALVRAKCLPEGCEETSSKFQFFLPSERHVDIGTLKLPNDEKLRRSLTSVRMVAQGPKPYHGFDFDDFPSLEVPVKGQKQVLLFRPDADESEVTVDTYADKIKTANQEQLLAIGKCAVTHTLNVADVMYWPAGWFCVAASIGKTPCYSFAYPMLVRLEDPSEVPNLTSTTESRKDLMAMRTAAQLSWPVLDGQPAQPRVKVECIEIDNAKAFKKNEVIEVDS